MVAALERLKRHINALASLHNTLTYDAKDGDGGDARSLNVLLNKLLPMLQLAAGDRPTQVEAQDVLVPMKHASSFALLVNELVANAIKHGRGGIRLALTEENANGAQGRIRLSVCDDGPGFLAGFDPERDAGMGLQLIHSPGEWDLQGELFFENRREGGACVGVTFPHPALTK